MQGPAGVRTEGLSTETENRSGLGDLEPGAMERPEGIVGPSGAAFIASRPEPCSIHTNGVTCLYTVFKVLVGKYEPLQPTLWLTPGALNYKILV